MKVELSRVRKLMLSACDHARISEKQAVIVVDHYLDGELRGKSSHGVAKFCFEAQFFKDRESDPEMVHERGAFAVIDAHREIGPLSATFAVDIVVRKAKQHGAAVVGMINTQRYGILSTWTEAIAGHGLMGIVTNTSRAEAAASGSRRPVLGVNPLAFALPTLDEPLSADMSTTLAPMGTLWESRRTATPLPSGAFIDREGDPSNDPHTARSAVIFGEHRGFSLSILLQALTGSLFGFPMGIEIVDAWTTGYTFIALDPSFASPMTGALAANSRMVNNLRQGLALDGGPLPIPGENGRRRSSVRRNEGTLDLPEQVMLRLQLRASGDLTSD